MAPPSAAATLTVTDSLSGAAVTVPVQAPDAASGTHAWIPANAFAQLRVPQTCPPADDPGATVPLRLFDPGFRNTAVCRSRISFVDGDAGRLLYRGYDIEYLVDNADFLEVAYLLIYGSLPTKEQYDKWVRGIMTHTYLHTELEKQMLTFRYDAHPMGMVISTLAALSTFHPEANPALFGEGLYMKPKIPAGKTPSPEDAERIKSADTARSRAVLRMMGKVTTIAANAYRHRQGRPYNSPMYGCLDYCENLLYMIDRLNEPNYRPDPRLVKILNKAFILLAENGSNCSTVMMRHLASSGVDPYTALSGAAGALFGERKSAAVIDMLTKIGSVDKIDEFLEVVKGSSARRGSLMSEFSADQGNLDRSRVRLMGFGHRIYKTHDPRVRICKNLVLELFELIGKTEIGELAIALEAKALDDSYFTERKLYPNIDYWSAVLFDTLRFPTDMFPVWMFIPRVAGLVAHLVESIDDPEYKIFRPRQIYIGETLRKYKTQEDPAVAELRSSVHAEAPPALDSQYVRSDPQAARRRVATSMEEIANATTWGQMDGIKQALDEIARSLNVMEGKDGDAGASVNEGGSREAPAQTRPQLLTEQAGVVGTMAARAASIRSALQTWVNSRVKGGSAGADDVSEMLNELKAEVKRLQVRQAQMSGRAMATTAATSSSIAMATSPALRLDGTAGAPDLLAGSGSPRAIARR